jgi:LysR family nitrogen assimilation transcriptional regulator
MYLRTLTNFLRVAEAGSVKGAAELIHIAQPALSRQIALLEQELGTKLFFRHARGVTLTEAGETLRRHAERILAEMERARDALSESVNVPSGTLSLGLPTSMRYVLSSSVVSAYRKSYPQVELKVHEAIGHVIEDMLTSRKLDVAILIAGSAEIDAELTPLVSEDVYLAGPPGSGLDMRHPVALTDLSELPMILLSPHNRLRLKISEELARHRLAFRANLEVEGQPLVLDLIKQGVGYTVLPFCAIQAEMAAGKISGAPIKGLAMTWTLGVNRLRAHVPAVREMIRMIHQAVDSRIATGEWKVVRPAPPAKAQKRGRRKRKGKSA